MKIQGECKRIVIVAAVFPPEPVVSANMAFDIASALSKEYDVTVLSPKPSRPLGKQFAKVKEDYPFKHVIVDSYTCPQSSLLGRLRESISFGKYTAAYISKNKNEIGVVYADSWPLFAQYELSRITRKYDIPLLMHIQDVYPDSYSQKMPRLIGNLFQKILLPLDKAILRKSTNIIGISPMMVDYLSKTRNIKKEKFMMVRNWQNDQKFIEKYSPLDDIHREKRFLFLGSINPTASVETIIRAFARAKITDASLSIIGTGPDRLSCERLAKELNVPVIFDQVDSFSVADKQSEADILLLTLKKGISYTATPSKLTAYLFSGRPIIAALEHDSDAGNMIKESKCGVVVSPEDVNALASAMKELSLKSSSHLNEMGIRGFQYAKEHLSRDYNMNLIIDKIISYNHV